MISKCSILFLISICYVSQCVALEKTEPSSTASSFVPTLQMHANWILTGAVTDEMGEIYHYFFQVQRHQETFDAIATLINAQTKKVILFEKGSANITNADEYHWRMGNVFLHFNPINDSFIFGVRTPKKQGFNFQVDMLKTTSSYPPAQSLRKGVLFVLAQTGALNGHVYSSDDNKDVFVTGKNAWFRQVWLTQDDETHHTVNGLLCRFVKGGGFYSTTLLESDARRASLATWINPEGVHLPMSQFVTLAKQEEAWDIRVSSPKLHVQFVDCLPASSVAAGFIESPKEAGFCVVSRDQI